MVHNQFYCAWKEYTETSDYPNSVSRVNSDIKQDQFFYQVHCGV